MKPSPPRLLTGLVGLLLFAFLISSAYSCLFETGRLIVFLYFILAHLGVHILYVAYARSKGLELYKMLPEDRINGFRSSPFSLLLAGAIITLSYFYLGIVCAVIIFLFFAILRMSKDTWEDFMKIRETSDETNNSK